MRFVVQHQQVGPWERGAVVDVAALPTDAWARLVDLGAVSALPADAQADADQAAIDSFMPSLLEEGEAPSAEEGEAPSAEEAAAFDALAAPPEKPRKGQSKDATS